MEDRLIVRFEHLEDMESTLHTLFDLVEYLLKYYNKLGMESVMSFLEQCCIFWWGIYFGIIYKAKNKGFPSSEDGK